MDSMITVEGLDFRYGRGDFRLRLPGLALARGSTTALIGPSGSGKTTLLNLLVVPAVYARWGLSGPVGD